MTPQEMRESVPTGEKALLWVHSAQRRWAKKVSGRTYYFGAIGCSYAQALTDYEARFGGRPTDPRRLAAEMRLAGRLGWLLNEWVKAQAIKAEQGDIRAGTFRDYRNIAKDLTKAVGTVEIQLIDGTIYDKIHAKYRKVWGPVRIRKVIFTLQRVLKWARLEQALPIPLLPAYRGPTKSDVRKWQSERLRGSLLRAQDIHDLLQVATVPMRAAIYLGINCGFRGSDIGRFEFRHLKEEDGRRYIDFPRPKTGIERILPVWPETEAAIREAVAQRAEPSSPEWKQIVLLSGAGNPLDHHRFVAEKSRSVQTATLAQMWKRTRGKAGLDIGGFGCLRTTFATIAHDAADAVAVDYVMGHVSSEIRRVYIGGAAWGRLEAVTDRVHDWLLNQEAIDSTQDRGAESVESGWSLTPAVAPSRRGGS